MNEIRFTKFEIARIIGARALQIAMGAPLLLDLKEKDFEKLKYNPIELSKLEFKEDILPITIKRPLPKRTAG
jgi:DNA-directed RNA polymerase subunit K/omega